MVGDLAAYRPGAKVVFFEGGNSEFDLSMVSRLFPAFGKEVNLVSGGNRSRVETLHKTLQRSVQAGKIPIKIYSVVDKDSGLEIDSSGEFRGHYSWDVYHIENYLLNPRFIGEALKNVNVHHNEVASEEAIERRLTEIARDQIGELISHKVRTAMGSELVEGLKLNSNPSSGDIGADLHGSIVKSIERIQRLAETNLSIDNIRKQIGKERDVLEQSLVEGDWKKHFKGRDILRAFVGEYVQGMQYKYFRDLIISQMVNSGYQPEGMRTVLDKIANA